MKWSLQFGLIIAAVFCHLAKADDSWTEYFLKELEAIPADPSSEEIQLLATLATNEPNPDREFAGAEVVNETALKKLLAIPDFPERLMRRIQEGRAAYPEKRTDVEGYESLRRTVVRRMGRIHHPGVVPVLGQLLDDWEWPGWKGDPRKRPPYDPEDPDTALNPPNCVHAARALSELIEKPPVSQKDLESYSFDEVEIYQLWYAQVKSGQRSFHIKGDPTEYRLEGTKAVAVNTTGPPSSKPAPGAAMESTPSGGAAPLQVILIIFACGILGLAVFAAVRARHQN